MRLRAGVAALLTVLVVLLTGCDPVESGSSESSGSAGSGPTAEAGCGSPGKRVAGQLPRFSGTGDEEVEVLAANPCVPLAGLVADVNDYIPEARNWPDGGNRAAFRSAVGKLSGGLGAVSDTAECAYQADRLAIGIYRHSAYPWSMGVVAVVRGSLTEDAITGLSCYLLGVSPLDDFGFRGVRPGPSFELCPGGSKREDSAGEEFRIAWIGSSDWMCGTLEEQLAT